MEPFRSILTRPTRAWPQGGEYSERHRLSGYSYDANGNLLSPSYVYDAENRIQFSNVPGGMVEYFYDAQNKRIWQGNCAQGLNCQQGIVDSDTVTLFGADGRQVGTYTAQAGWTNNQTQITLTFVGVTRRAYFGGKLVGQTQSGTMLAAVQDRLGSVGKYYPYGGERNSPPLMNDQVKFATYTRDSGTGLDYADQRYYASTFGRFMTADPYKSGAGAGDPRAPQSWNRYAYVLSDPINHLDPGGTDCAGYKMYDANGKLVVSEDWGCDEGLLGPGAMPGDPGFAAQTAVMMTNEIGIASALVILICPLRCPQIRLVVTRWH